MIYVNLTPPDELEDTRWFLPDVLTIVAVGFLAYFAVQYFIDSENAKLVAIKRNIEQKNQEIASLQPEMKRFKQLDSDRKDLEKKIVSLEKITKSRVRKFLPVIFLEHLQNMKPDGMWFYTVQLNDGSETRNQRNRNNQNDQTGKPKDPRFVISGRAFDSIILSEFVATMRATASQQSYGNDIRTQVFMQDLSIKGVNINGSGPDVQRFAELAGFPNFTLEGVVKDRSGQHRQNTGNKNPKVSTVATPVHKGAM